METPTTLIGLVIFLSLGMFGLLAWLIRHLFSVTIPALQAKFADEMKAEREMCRSQISVNNKHFEEVLGRVNKVLEVIKADQEEYRRNQEAWRERWQKVCNE